jgi:hypothetical protein
MDELLNVYVPAPGSTDMGLHGVPPRSGIVGTEQEDGRVLIDYEGNEHCRPGLIRYADRVRWAASRHILTDGKRAQTTARASVRRDSLVEVGLWDGAIGEVVPHRDADNALAGWLGTETVGEEEVTATALYYRRRREERQLAASHNPLDRLKATQLRKRGFGPTNGR